MALDRIRMLTGDNANAVAADEPADVYLFTEITGAPDFAPATPTASGATPVPGSPGLVDIVMINPTTVSLNPANMSVWELPLKDPNGDAIVGDLGTADIMKMFGYHSLTAAPTDVCFMFGWVDGPFSATSPGVVGMCVATSGVWRTYHSINAGSSWSAPQISSAGSALARGGMLQCGPGPSLNSGRPNTTAMDAAGLPISTANTSTAPGTANSAGNYDRAVFGVGWATGSGGVGATHRFGVSSFFQGLGGVPNNCPF